MQITLGPQYNVGDKPPKHFGRVMLYGWNSHPRMKVSLLKTFFWSFLVVYGRPLCFPFSVTLIIQYALYIIFLKTLHLPFGEGVILLKPLEIS